MKKFGTENELCEWFRDHAERHGWDVWPETAGWDMLLIRDEVRIGIEAKKSASVRVLAQALSPTERLRGPNFHAVLVPKCGDDFRRLARQCRIVVFSAQSYALQNLLRLGPGPRMEWSHSGHRKLPPYKPRVRAGVPGPIQLTEWKIAAIKICLVLREKGYVTSRDFRRFGIGAGTWVQRQWIVDSGKRTGRLYHYIAGSKMEWWDEQHPEVAAEIRGDMGAEDVGP